MKKREETVVKTLTEHDSNQPSSYSPLIVAKELSFSPLDNNKKKS